MCYGIELVHALNSFANIDTLSKIENFNNLQTISNISENVKKYLQVSKR